LKIENYTDSQKPVNRHSREGGSPESFKISWITAFAGMTPTDIKAIIQEII
jgi:hypothetical protein